MYINRYIYTCRYIHTHAHTHTCTYTYINRILTDTHTHTYTYTHSVHVHIYTTFICCIELYFKGLTSGLNLNQLAIIPPQLEEI